MRLAWSELVTKRWHELAAAARHVAGLHFLRRLSMPAWLVAASPVRESIQALKQDSGLQNVHMVTAISIPQEGGPPPTRACLEMNLVLILISNAYFSWCLSLRVEG